MPKKEYKVDYMATEKNRRHKPGTMVPSYDKPEWVDEKALIKELNTYKIPAYHYVPVVVEIRMVPTEHEKQLYANEVRRKIVAAMGYQSENALIDGQGTVSQASEVADALKVLVEARRLEV